MNLSDFQGIEINDMQNWPTKVKAVAVTFVSVVIIAVSWFFIISPMRLQIAAINMHERTKITAIKSEKQIVANLPFYQKQIRMMNSDFSKFLMQLPNSQQMPSLIDSISAAGNESNLQFSLFKPTGIIVKSFYKEVPISINVKGSYNNDGLFLQKIANLPRIVTFHNMKISRVPFTGTKAARATQKQQIIMSGTLITYEYLKNGNGT
jgi:type IV pilus assembly protein PilO